jgi:hypothetical protein
VEARGEGESERTKERHIISYYDIIEVMSGERDGKGD